MQGLEMRLICDRSLRAEHIGSDSRDIIPVYGHFTHYVSYGRSIYRRLIHDVMRERRDTSLEFPR